MNKFSLQIKKMVVLLLVLTLIPFMMSGCWNRRELDKIAIVAAGGIDKENKDKIKITAQVFKVGEIKSPQSGGSATGKPYVNFEGVATTSFEAIRKITQIASRKLYWSHNQIFVFGKEIAQEGIEKYIDFFVRDHETRLMVNVLVSKGTAHEILTTETDLETIPAMNINDIIKDLGATSQAPQITLKDIAERLLSKTSAAVAPLVEVQEINKKKHARIAGTAVFKKGKMVGELTPEESRGYLWVIGKVKSGIINVKTDDGTKRASLEIIRANNKINADIKDGQLVITVIIKEEGTLNEQDSPKNLTELPLWHSLELLQAAAIHREITAALKKSQEYNADIFGFGEVVHRKYPLLWKDLEKQWDELFPYLKVNIEVQAKLRRSGLITKPISPSTEE